MNTIAETSAAWRSFAVILAILLFLPGGAQASEVPFGTQSVISTNAAQASAVFAADVDGDGDKDVLSASYLNDTIAWYENNGASPPVWTARTISTAADNASSVFAADVDGDGDMDALSASVNDAKIAWYENNGGSPPLWTERVISTTALAADSVFAADVDADGDMDVLSASLNDDTIAWYENNGASPPLWTKRTISTNADQALAVFAADVDGDGDTDVLSASQGDGKIAWYESNGASPPVWTARTISTAAAGASSVFAADVDGDGDTDVLSASQTDDKIAWYENNGGSPPTWTARTISTAADIATSVFAADVDGDGDTDILSASRGDNKIAWYESDGATPPAWTLRTISTAAQSARSVFATDVDGDGDTDVLSASQFDNKIAWYQNRTIHRSATFPAESVISTSLIQPEAVFTADVDGDGDMDVLSASLGDDKIAWYENDGASPPAWTSRTISTTTAGAISVFAADVDGDGDMDVLSGGNHDHQVSWFENTDGAGAFGPEQVIATTPLGAVSIFAADLDGDADTDVLSASANQIAMYRNDGGAPPAWTQSLLTNQAPEAAAVFAADVDRDGDADVVWAAYSSDTIAWHENLGAGVFAGRQIISTAGDGPVSVFVTDLDGDGDADVLSASLLDNEIAWYENTDGSGTFAAQQIISTSAVGLEAVFAADVDGDGDQDVLSASYVDDKIAWYENGGGPSPSWTAHVVTTEADVAHAVSVADIDRDGDLDVVSAAGSFFSKIAWYPNRGGQFALATTSVTPPVPVLGAINPLLKIEVTHRGHSQDDTDLELSTLELLFEQAPGDPLTSAEANVLVENLHVYLDNGDGNFDFTDFMVATVGTLSLVGGRQTVSFADGDGNFRVAYSAPQTYFVAAQIAADAPSQSTNDFRVTHVTESSSTAEDAAADIPLSLEFVPNTASDFVTYAPVVTSVLPQNNALSVPVGTNVSVVFSEPVDPATVTSSSFFLVDPLSDPVAANLGLAPDGRTTTLDPSGSLAFNTLYTVVVTSAVKDLAGQGVGPFISRFVTVAAPVSGTPLPSVADQSVLPSPPPGPGPGGASTAMAPLAGTLGPNLGYSVSAAGDLNHDQLADFVGGAPGYALTGLPEAGAVAIYLGSNAAEPSSGNHPREVADVIFTGSAAHDRAGSSVAAGFDFDGDGIGDILIGAEQINRMIEPPEVIGTGKVYLIYFKPQEYDFDGDSIPDYLERSELFVPLSLVGTSISGAVLTGAGAGDQAGYAVAAGGFLESSDTRDDIVIGAPGASGNDGKVYVLFSSSGVSGPRSLGNVGASIPGTVYLGSLGERLGSSVALPGDVTAPAGPDIAMGAPLADTTQPDAGRVYVAAAGSLLTGTVNAPSIPMQVHGDQACEELGFAVAGGGDNRASGSPQLPGGDPDLLIGAPYRDAIASPGNSCLDTTPVPNAGRVIQTTGRLPSSVIGASQVGSSIEGVIWRGVQAGAALGWAVGRLGDLSGNRLSDIGLSAPFASPGMNGAGAVYVVEGSANAGLLGSIDADQVGQIVSGGIFLGTQTGEEAGLALCAAGDLDGDGLSGSTTADDFTVGSPGWDSSLGTVHQVLGTLLQQPGECTALGCTVADLSTGAVLVVPPNSLASGVRYRFAVSGMTGLTPTACGSHSLGGKSLVGSSNYTRIDCGTPPCGSPGFSIGPSIEVSTVQNLESQLTQNESLALRYCDSTLGWRIPTTGPTTGQVRDNSFVVDRKAVAASGVDTLRLYGVFFDDADHDDARDTCDCNPTNGAIWTTPGDADITSASGQGVSPTTLSWGPPACLGGAPTSLVYDTIRSTNRANFVTGAVCVEANGADTTSTDTQNPPIGQAFYYIVSPENGCASAPACLQPACAQIPARDC